MRGGMRAHDLGQGMKLCLRGSHNRDVSPEITAGESVQAPVSGRVPSMRWPSHMRNRVVGDFGVNIARWRARLAYHFCDIAIDYGGTCSKSGRAEILEERVVGDRLGFPWPKMDDKFFVLW